MDHVHPAGAHARRQQFVVSGPVENWLCWMPVTICEPDAIVNGVVDPAKAHEFRALIDTGATRSAMRPELAQRLRLVPSGRGQFRGVGTSIEALTTIATIAYRPESGPLISRVATFAVVSMEPMLLLGMSELAHGVLTVDGRGANPRWAWEIEAAVD